MPSSVVHLFVAERLTEFLDIKDKPQFYLGAISPDAVNLEGFADQKTRYDAHIRSRDVSQWLFNIKNFISEKESDYLSESDFLKGFIIHLITDIAWDEAVQPELFEGLIKAGFGEETLGREKWNELYRFNGMLMAYPQWEKIKNQLKKSHGVAVSTVSAELLEKFRDNLLSEDYKKVDFTPPLVLSPKNVDITACKAKELYSKIR